MSGEGSWHRSLALRICGLGRRYGADGLNLVGLKASGWGARNDGRDGCKALRSQGIGAQSVERGQERGESIGKSLISGCERSSGRWLHVLARDGGPQTKLQLGLCGSEERLVDLGLVGVQGDVGGSRVGVALEHDLVVGLDLEDASKLQMRPASVSAVSESVASSGEARQAARVIIRGNGCSRSDIPSQGAHELRGPSAGA